MPEPQIENGELESELQARRSNAPHFLLRFVFREERFFLALSVFIGIFAGLAVVCFRYAIDLSRIYFLGSETGTSHWRFSAARVSARPREWGQSDQSGTLYL